MYVKVKR